MTSRKNLAVLALVGLIAWGTLALMLVPVANAQNVTGTITGGLIPNVDDSTLTAVVVGGILGALLRNFLGYRDEARKNPGTPYNVEDLILTLVFAIPVGTMTVLAVPILFDISVDGSAIKSVVLIIISMATTMGVDQWKAYTVSRKQATGSAKPLDEQ